MAEAAVQLRPGINNETLKVTITGMLREQRKHDGTFYSTVLSPAPDQYSAPMPFEIRSRRSLGTRDEVVTVACRVGGFFKRQYTLTDDRTGEVRRIKPVTLTLDALDGDDSF